MMCAISFYISDVQGCIIFLKTHIKFVSDIILCQNLAAVVQTMHSLMTKPKITFRWFEDDRCCFMHKLLKYIPNTFTLNS